MFYPHRVSEIQRFCLPLSWQRWQCRFNPSRVTTWAFGHSQMLDSNLWPLNPSTPNNVYIRLFRTTPGRPTTYVYCVPPCVTTDQPHIITSYVRRSSIQFEILSDKSCLMKESLLPSESWRKKDSDRRIFGSAKNEFCDLLWLGKDS